VAEEADKSLDVLGSRSQEELLGDLTHWLGCGYKSSPCLSPPTHDQRKRYVISSRFGSNSVNLAAIHWVVPKSVANFRTLVP
jgi:hypothetical protein